MTLFNAIYYLVSIASIGILLCDRKNILDYANKIKKLSDERLEKIKAFYGEV